MNQLQASRPRLLIADPDRIHSRNLALALEAQGFSVETAHDGVQTTDLIETFDPHYAVLELRLPDTTGLKIIPRLRSAHPECKIIVLTGFPSIATAVESIKRGAVQYLTKPARVGEVIAAFEGRGHDFESELMDGPLSVDRLEWEHIQRVLTECDGNISATARALKMHRRTLQRKLYKNPPTR